MKGGLLWGGEDGSIIQSRCVSGLSGFNLSLLYEGSVLIIDGVRIGGLSIGPREALLLFGSHGAGFIVGMPGNADRDTLNRAHCKSKKPVRSIDQRLFTHSRLQLLGLT